MENLNRLSVAAEKNPGQERKNLAEARFRRLKESREKEESFSLDTGRAFYDVDIDMVVYEKEALAKEEELERALKLIFEKNPENKEYREIMLDGLYIFDKLRKQGEGSIRGEARGRMFMAASEISDRLEAWVQSVSDAEDEEWLGNFTQEIQEIRDCARSESADRAQRLFIDFDSRVSQMNKAIQSAVDQLPENIELREEAEREAEDINNLFESPQEKRRYDLIMEGNALLAAGDVVRLESDANFRAQIAEYGERLRQFVETAEGLLPYQKQSFGEMVEYIRKVGEGDLSATSDMLDALESCANYFESRRQGLADRIYKKKREEALLRRASQM